MRLQSVTLDRLRIEDERSYRHIALYDELKQALVRDRVAFRVPANDARDSRWDRVLFLNLTFWTAEGGDILESDSIAADVMMHAAWHHVTRRALDALGTNASQSPEGFLLGEAIASAFDMYLVGRLLGHSPDASFLETQVPAMAEVAEQAGLEQDAFEAMLEEVARDPEKAFEDLRELLFDASTSLLRARSVDEAAAMMERFDDHRFGALLHHYELATWILYAKAYAKDTGKPDESVLEIDRALRRADVALGWLETNWINGRSGGPSAASGDEGKR